jgi:hypothetical protein
LELRALLTTLWNDTLGRHFVVWPQQGRSVRKTAAFGNSLFLLLRLARGGATWSTRQGGDFHGIAASPGLAALAVTAPNIADREPALFYDGLA